MWNLFPVDGFDPLVLDAELVEARVHLLLPVRTSFQVDQVDLVHPEGVLRRRTKDKVGQLRSEGKWTSVGHDFKFEIRKIEKVVFQAEIRTEFFLSFFLSVFLSLLRYVMLCCYVLPGIVSRSTVIICLSFSIYNTLFFFALCLYVCLCLFGGFYFLSLCFTFYLCNSLSLSKKKFQFCEPWVII